MGCPALTYHQKEDISFFQGLWKKSGGSEKSYKYYPFGLQTSTSWTRENTIDNNYLYNAANELNKTTGWYEMYYRGYDPAIGRMLQVDPYAPMYASYTTYNYAINNPVMLNDPSGGQMSAQGYSDYQLRALYRVERARGNYSDFGDWASDNLDEYGGGGGGRMIEGTHGQNYAFGQDGRIGKWVLTDSYDVGFYSTSGEDSNWVPTGDILDVYQFVPTDPSNSKKGPYGPYDYKSRMTKEELAIFNQMPLKKRIAYLLNAKSASDMAQKLYGDYDNPNSVIAGKGDAFRHIYFSALNAEILGIELARKLGQAHESELSQNPLEAEMDLFNNNIGYEIFNQLDQKGLGEHFYNVGAAQLATDAINSGKVKLLWKD